MSPDTSTRMFDILDETDKDLVAIRVGRGTRRGYEDHYSLLARRTDQYGPLRVYEEVPDWSILTFLTHLHGIVPDLRYGSSFSIDRYAAVGDSVWAKLLFKWWRAIRPVWPVSPDRMGYFDIADRASAYRWLREDTP